MIVTKEHGAEKYAYGDETQKFAREKCYEAEKAGGKMMQEEGNKGIEIKNKDQAKEKQEKEQINQI